MSETNAPIGQWESIKKNFAESVIKMFPISGRKNTLEIQEVTFDESKADPQDIRAREIAKHQEKTWGIPVFAKFTLRDKATGQVINESKQKLAVLPRLTPLDTYIVSGGEWNSAYQWRLKSGIYAKITDAGKLETEFNLNGAGKDFARESRLKIPFDPETKQFKFKYGTVSTPLYSILKANDVSDDTMKKAWGDDIFNANFKKNWQQDVTKLYNTKLKKRGLLAESDSFEHIKSAIVKEFNKAEVLPETTKLTIGKEVKNLDGNALLAGSTHILGVSRGNKPDDVYSLYFKHLLGLDDFIAEKFGASKTAQAIKSKIRNTLDKKEKVSQILANDLFSKPLSQVFIGNTLSQRPDQVNPIDILSSKSITTITGPGGISSSHAIRNPMKIISQSHLAMLDPILTPESESTGITLHLPIGAKKVGREAQTLVYDLLHKKFKHINPAELHGSYTVLPDQIKWKGGVPQPIAKENGNGKVTAVDPLTHEFTEVPLEKARYVLPSPRNFFSEATNLIPFLQCNQGNRTMTGSRQPAQGVALKYKEAPLVQVRSNDPTKSFEHVFGQKFSHQSPADGKVVAVVKDNLGYTNEIHVEDKTGKVHKTQIYNNFPLNDKKAFLHADPVVEVGQTVTRGQQIADSNFSDKGTLAVGTNLHVGYMPYGAFTFEDGIVVSESGAKKLTSEHLHKTSLELDPKNDKVSLSKFISHISSVGKKLKKDKVANLDENGIIKPGSIVKPGDLLVTAISKNTIEGQLASMASKMKGATSAYKDKSLVWDHDYEGKVVKVIPKPGNNGYTVYVRTSEPAKVGDKLCYDEETEVLTSTGWKFVKDVSLEDEVCTLNPSTDHIEYHSPTQLHYYPIGGEMYSLESDQVNFFVTTDHNMYVRKHNKRKFESVPAKSVYGKNVEYKKDGIWVGKSPEFITFPALEVKAGQSGRGKRIMPEIKMPTETYMVLLGAFLAEGCVLNSPGKGNFGIEICQIKPDYRQRFIDKLTELGVTFNTTKDRFRIYSKQLMLHFSQFGKAKDKYIPNEVFSYSKKDLTTLFDWMMWGDGHTKDGNSIAYYSISKKLVDGFQRLCLLIGKAGNVRINKEAKVQIIKGKPYNCSTLYTVGIVGKDLTPEINGKLKNRREKETLVQNYEKPVYCLTVQNHVIYTRRKGRVAWSFNCGRAGDKNIIGAIIPDEHMPRVGGKDGQIFDLLTAPSGVVSRINLGQLLEMGASKIAKKTGQPYVTTNFAPGVDYTEKIKKEMAAHGISDTDRVYDPLLGKEVEGDVLTGYKYIIKQKHQVEKKESVRGLDQALSGKYSTNFDPQRGKGEGAQAISPLDLYALLGHGARANLKEMSSYKAELQHDTATGMHTDGDFWNRVMLGMPLKPPKPTFAYRKFEGYLTGLGINLKKEGNTTVLTPLTDKGVLALSNGEIKEADQIRGKDDQEIKGGLFDPKITGGIADAPGKGMHWSHLKLAEPYPNPIFVGTLHLPGPAAVLSGLPFKQFEQVAKGQEDIVVNGKSLTGGKAIEEILKKVNVKKDLDSIKKQLPLLKGSELNKANKKAKFLQALDRLNMRPEEAYIMNHVPILPPVFRPITVLPDGSSTSADANTLYKSLILLNNGLKEKEVLRNFPDKEKELRSSTYDALKALIGLGKVPSYDGNKKLKGLLQTVAGDSPKTGFFQSKVMKRRQELSMRSTIIPGPDMGIDQIGLPKNAAMELYKPFVIRELVRSGKDLIEATKDVKEGTSMAWKALDNAIKNRPVLVKRDPVLHKYNVQALLPKLIEGSAIAMHPLLASAYNFDHDGDTMAVHLPLTEQARQEALDKMLPSSNLFSATNYGIMHAPDQEAIIGINNLSHWGQKKELSFNSLADLKKNKDIKVSDVVKVKIGSEYKETTKGRALLVENAPLEMDHSKLLHDPSLELKKSSIHKMLETFARKDPKGYPTLVDDWRKKGNERAHEMGFSFSLSDLSPLKVKRNAILAPYHEEVAKVNKSSLSQDNKDAKIVALYNKATEELDEKLSKDYTAMGNNMFKMVDTKARGSLAQFRQTVIAPMLLVDANNKVITTPVLNSYSEGLNVSQYWTSLHGARKGTLQRAQGTSVPGALAKELINLNIATPITKHDCGDEHGLEMKLIDKKGNNEIDVTDRFLAKDEHGFHKGTLITPEVFGKLKANNVTSVTVRSPLTCKVPQGICSTCFGLNENGHKHEIGTNIGVLASQALSEPAVQLAMDCSADGNLVSVKVSGLITTLTFEQLWEHIGGFTSEDDGIETKMPINLEVWDHNKWVEVRTFQRHKVDEPMVLVRTSSGRSFIVKATHPSWARVDITTCPECKSQEPIEYWSHYSDNTIVNCKNCKARFTITRKLYDDQIEKVVPAGKLLDSYVPVSKQLVDENAFTSNIPPYVMGFFLAEGNIKRTKVKADIEEGKTTKRMVPSVCAWKHLMIVFTQNEGKTRDFIKSELTSANLPFCEPSSKGITISNIPLMKEFYQLGIKSHKKQLPMGFLNAPLQWKLDLLAGLLDGDGCIEKNNKIALDTTSWSLASQVQELVRSIGGFSMLYKTTVKELTRHQGFRLSIRLPHKLRSVKDFPVCTEASSVIDSYEKVTAVQPVLYDGWTYDFSTATKSYTTNGITTHNSFHSGGVAQSRGGGSSSKLERLSQLLNLPKGLPYSATLAKYNGVIHSVEKDTAGGHKVFIQNNTGVHEHYVPSTLDLTVEKGHEVKRGEAISNGPVNPHQLLQLKDMGAVRKYLTTEMGDMYKDVGGVRRRNVEVVVKNLTNLTEVVSSGSSDHLPGDILSTAIVDAHNRTVPTENRILHKPILRGIKETALLKDEDYLSKMNFQRIQNTVIEGVGKGWKTTTKDTLSPLPAWAAGTIDVQKDKNNPKY